LLALLKEKAEGKADRPAATVRPVEVTGHTPDAVARAVAYCKKYPPGVEGQDASGNCFALACRLVRGFQLDPETALRVMLHSRWNAGARPKPGAPPPGSEKELRHKIEGALRAPEREVEGYLLRADRGEPLTPRARPAKGRGADGGPPPAPEIPVAAV